VRVAPKCKHMNTPHPNLLPSMGEGMFIKEKDDGAHQYTRFFGGKDSTVMGMVRTGL